MNTGHRGQCKQSLSQNTPSLGERVVIFKGLPTGHIGAPCTASLLSNFNVVLFPISSRKRFPRILAGMFQKGKLPAVRSWPQGRDTFSSSFSTCLAGRGGYPAPSSDTVLWGLRSLVTTPFLGWMHWCVCNEDRAKRYQEPACPAVT